MIWWFLLAALVLYIVRSIYRSHQYLKNVSTRHVFITGCDTGFGNALAKKLDLMGLPVFAACLTAEGEQELKETCSSRLCTLRLDVSDRNSIRCAVDFVKSMLPENQGLWGMVNNAGVINPFVATEWLSDGEFDKVINVNLIGLCHMTRALLPLIRKSRGRIVNMASAAMMSPIPGFTPYNISKSGVEAFTNSLRRELYSLGVSVSTVVPGGFQTNIFGDAQLNRMKEINEELGSEEKEAYPKMNLEGLQNVYKANPDLSPVLKAQTHGLLGVYPKRRYMVGIDCWLFIQGLGKLPDCVGDFIFGWR